jgi:hypothetical protein
LPAIVVPPIVPVPPEVLKIAPPAEPAVPFVPATLAVIVLSVIVIRPWLRIPPPAPASPIPVYRLWAIVLRRMIRRSRPKAKIPPPPFSSVTTLLDSLLSVILSKLGLPSVV